MLRQRCSNVATTSWQHQTANLSQRRRLTSPWLSFLILPERYDNVNHNVVTTLSQSHWPAGIAQVKTLSNVIWEDTNNIVQEKILFIVVLTLLRQYCTSKNLCNILSKRLQTTVHMKNPVLCCLNNIWPFSGDFYSGPVNFLIITGCG